MAATKIKKPKKTPKKYFEEPEAKNDFTAFVEQVKENPVRYGAAAGFIVLCGLAGLLYQNTRQAQSEELATAYARAMGAEDPEQRVEQLEALTTQSGPLLAEVLYMLGEEAFDIQEYDKAKAAFERVLDEFADSRFAPDSAEGLGVILEEQSQDYEAARVQYERILTEWPDSSAALRQPINIARCYEKVGDVAGAVGAYHEQIGAFPSSTVAEEAEAALKRLFATNPELFEGADAGIPTAVPETPDAVPAEEETETILPDLEEEPVELPLRLELPTPDSIDLTPSEEATEDVSVDVPDAELAIPSEPSEDAETPAEESVSEQ